MKNDNSLDFEAPIRQLYQKIEELKDIASKSDKKNTMDKEIESLKKKAAELKKKIYDNLEPINIVKIARHPDRPLTLDYIQNVFEGFVELHGDRLFGDDKAIIGGFAKIDGQKIMIIGEQRGHTTKENIYRNFGMPQPEGYRKALRIMKLAQKLKLPIISLIDTSGAFPGLGSEERGVAEAIAMNLQEMSALTVPVICIVIGEGGSGGALGIAVGNTVAMLKYSVYSVISPEGCAAILWRDASKADIAAKNLALTSEMLMKFGVVDTVIEEPQEGAHTAPEKVYKKVKQYLLKELKKYSGFSIQELKDQRYKRFRGLGSFNEEL